MTAMKDEQRWIQQAQAGDQAAFEALVRLHMRSVYNLALGYTGSHHDAEEITQTVFLKAWKGFSQFRGDAALRTWLYRLTRNACTDLFRQNQKRRDTLSLEAEDLAPIPDSRPSPEEETLRREQARHLRAALARLPEHHRTILLLREMEGLDYEAIAQTLELPIGTVRSRLARARKALAELLREEGNLWDIPASNEGKGGMEDA